MRQKIKNSIVLGISLIISISFLRCQKEDEILNAKSADISLAKKWFAKYESSSENYELFQSLNYEWDKAETKNSEDGTETVIVPVVELKNNQEEIWEQKLYLYKLRGGRYKALLFEIYPDKNVQSGSQSVDGGNFNGYMSVWDLKTGFVRSAKFVNNRVTENGIVRVLSNDKASKAPPLNPCEDGNCNDSPGGGNPFALREVLVKGPKPKSNGTPVAYYGPRSAVIGGTTPGGYTSPRGGSGSSGGGGSNYLMPPPPEIPIPDIKKFLSCLKVDTYATLAVFAEKTNLVNGNVDHAFISISQGDNVMIYGFYPANGYDKSFSGPGIMGENGGHIYDVSANIGQISPQQLQKIISLSEKYQSSWYDLNANNCSDFATDVLNIAGIVSDNWFDTPGTVSKILEKVPNHTSKSNYAPKTKRTCH